MKKTTLVCGVLALGCLLAFPSYSTTIDPNNAPQGCNVARCQPLIIQCEELCWAATTLSCVNNCYAKLTGCGPCI